MTPQTFVFIGRSGCGKGTQAALLDEVLRTKDPHTPIYHLETGAKFREFIAKNGYTSDLARDIMKQGKRQPDFLAVWIWSHLFIERFTGGEHVIIDGAPRSLYEAQILGTAFSFYKRIKPAIIHLRVSRHWSEQHLLTRGRSDDRRDDIKTRLDWYERDVAPAVEFYRAHPDYTFIEINGEESIERVHGVLVKTLNLV